MISCTGKAKKECIKLWGRGRAMLLFAAFLSLMYISNQANAGSILQWPVPGHTEWRDHYTPGKGVHANNAIDIIDNQIGGADIYAAIGGTVEICHQCPNQHYGVDKGCPNGCNGFGNGLVIHGDDGRTYQYAHMLNGSIPESLRRVGAPVTKGQLIGKVGTTGNSSANHLHFGICYGNYWEGIGDPTAETYVYELVSDYTVTYYDNGGTGGPGSRIVTIGTSNYADISWKLPVKAGDSFLGYYTQATGGELVYDSNGYAVAGTYWRSKSEGGDWKYGGNLLLYAHWSSGTVRLTHTVTYNDNGGTGGPGSRTVTVATSNYGDISWALPTKANNTFMGYYSERIGGEQVYDQNGYTLSGTYWGDKSDGGFWKYDGDVTLYAHWLNHTVTYHDNGGTGGPGSRTVTIGTSNYGDISWALPRKTNDTFRGYYTEITGGERVYDENGYSLSGTYWGNKSDGGFWKYDDDVHLYAHWSSGYNSDLMEPDFVLPSDLIIIESEAFRGGTFTRVILSKQTRAIGKNAFADCTALRSIYIPEATTEIDEQAFGDRKELIIYGPSGSYAQRYAQQHGFKFVVSN